MTCGSPGTGGTIDTGRPRKPFLPRRQKIKGSHHNDDKQCGQIVGNSHASIDFGDREQTAQPRDRSSCGARTAAPQSGPWCGAVRARRSSARRGPRPATPWRGRGDEVAPVSVRLFRSSGRSLPPCERSRRVRRLLLPAGSRCENPNSWLESKCAAARR
jgi:hypothetical protein